jgi:hypothetical protein
MPDSERTIKKREPGKLGFRFSSGRGENQGQATQTKAGEAYAIDRVPSNPICLSIEA